MSLTHATPDISEFLRADQGAWSETYHEKRERSDADEISLCVVCGRKTIAGKRILVTLGLSNTNLIHPDDVAAVMDSDPGFMGTWALGPECGKNIPAEYRETEGN